MHRTSSAARVGFVVLLWVGTAGCGNRLYPVSGKVTLADGQPVTKGLVIFEGKEGDKPVTARGDIEPDGSYRLGTHWPGDGTPAGKYQVLISPRINVDAPEARPFDARYTEFKTSGLSFEVTAGTNEFPIRLDRPGKGKR